MSIRKLSALFVFAAASMFADAVVFTFGGTNSSLTLGRFGISPVIGAGGVTEVQREGYTPYALNAGIAFVSGSRGPVSNMPMETLTSGGGWAIVGSGTVNSVSFANEILIAGTFGNNTAIAHAGNTNLFGSLLIVDAVNPAFLAALGLQGFVSNSNLNTVGLDRPGTWNPSTYAFGNGPSGFDAPYNGTLTFEGTALAVPEPMEISLFLAGLGLCVRFARRKSVVQA